MSASTTEQAPLSTASTERKPSAQEIPTPSSVLSRTQSRSSDRGRTPSISGASIGPPQISPDPAYIAASAAEHVVATELSSRGRKWSDGAEFDEEHPVDISPSALALINTFLDHLLFGFLAASRSTSILSLRPAISEILKPRLAREAIEGADEELRGYLAGGDDEELLDFHNGQELKAGSNLNLIFRRTRLRCMVYTRFGDMEEEDEEDFLDGESMPDDEQRHRLSRDLGNVSPAAAIFLTSIIEFVGEQALIVAGENALNRTSTKKTEQTEPLLVVEDRDVEKIGFNKTLGRLWRSWKKRGRVSNVLLSPGPSSFDQSASKAGSERGSRATSFSEYAGSSFYGDDPRYHFPPKESPIEPRLRKNAPKTTDLPEEPDFQTDPEDSPREIKQSLNRPRSMLNLAEPIKFFRPKPEKGATVEGEEEEGDETVTLQTPRPEEAFAPKKLLRSASLPNLRYTPREPPADEEFKTPTEERENLEESLDAKVKDDEKQPEDPAEAASEETTTTDESKASESQPEQAAVDGHAVSTIYDGVLKRDSKPIPIDPSLASRGVSMSEYSEQESGTLDPDMTPQALNFKKTPTEAEEEGTAGPEANSRISATSSSNYSFQGGTQSPIQPEPPASVLTSKAPPPTSVPEEARVEPKKFERLAAVQGDQLRTYDESGTAVKRDIPRLYEGPSDEDVIYQPPPSKSVPEDDDDERVLASPTIANSEDIASASPPQYSDLPVPRKPAQGSMVPPNAVDMRRQPVAVSQGTERAAVQRVSPSSPSGHRGSPTSMTIGRASTSSRSDTNIRTAPPVSSPVSAKIKGMMGRDSADYARQPLSRTRSSEAAQDGAAPSPALSGNAERDFENLINSEETIQYTLTPQNMREIEQPDSPRWSPKVTATSMTPEQRSPNTAVQGAERAIPASQNYRAMNGLRANPPEDEYHSPQGSPATAAKAFPQPPPKSTSTGKPKNLVARDAVAPQDDSLRDFADFIRSSGPDSDAKTLTGNRAASGPAHVRVNSNNSLSKAPGNKLSKSGPGRSPSKLKARDPIASPTNTTAELAEFFRSGPPGASVGQRSVTSPPQANGRASYGIGSGVSVASTQDSFAPSKMTVSSTNSRTGLLDNRASARSTASQRPNATSGGAGGPVRKQRRVKDPYSLDSDDEDDDLYDGLAPQREDEQESLGDFLKNYSPPPSIAEEKQQQQQPSAQLAAAAQKNRKSSSGTSMRERIAKNLGDYRPHPPKKNSLDASSNTSKSPPTSQTGAARRSPQQTQVQQQQQQQRVAPQLPPLNSMNTNGAGPQPQRARVNKANLQARDETRGPGRSSGMADLADFLKETEPPGPMFGNGTGVQTSVVSSGRGDGPGVGKMDAGGSGSGSGGGGLGRVFGGMRKKRSII